ncbi:hypothetical protein CFP71_01685 [Amycolatopsis thailandensis]|uniref:Condensation domain-containing protein n=1 Tax=Amycolatopsis thailandensis TaxID=589330 RepID=A0A229SIB9_9PSEU|nr:hypothetical protein [Amycolatopsis thailandensis]OXM58603.1 hypothetical protein CFP71_01685 [Amycolatopsis thailandensis]
MDLGLVPGRWYAPANETDRLLSSQETEVFEARCRTAGGGMFLGLQAALAMVMPKLGGPEVYRALMPVNDRGGDYAIGWFINALPVEVAVRKTFTHTLAEARKSYERAREHLGVHYLRAWRLLGGDARDGGYRPVNFFSYNDFRRAPSAEGNVHLWFSGSNGFMFWLHRDHYGLHVNSIYADTSRTADIKGALLRAFRRELAGRQESARAIIEDSSR